MTKCAVLTILMAVLFTLGVGSATAADWQDYEKNPYGEQFTAAQRELYAARKALSQVSGFDYDALISALKAYSKAVEVYKAIKEQSDVFTKGHPFKLVLRVVGINVVAIPGSEASDFDLDGYIKGSDAARRSLKPLGAIVKISNAVASIDWPGTPRLVSKSFRTDERGYLYLRSIPEKLASIDVSVACKDYDGKTKRISLKADETVESQIVLEAESASCYGLVRGILPRGCEPGRVDRSRMSLRFVHRYSGRIWTCTSSQKRIDEGTGRWMAKFRRLRLLCGNYRVTVTAKGYRKVTVEVAVKQAPLATRKDFLLKPLPPSREERKVEEGDRDGEAMAEEKSSTSFDNPLGD